jgi:acylphosphatase
MTKAVEVRITGRVQGVSFRYWTQQQARELGVTGWVRNEPDGSVTGHFEGAAGAVDGLVAWCADGPTAARVDSVDVVGTEPTGTREFVVRGV